MATSRTPSGSVAAMEIVLRYYYQRGAVAQNLQSDKCLDEAVSVLDDSKLYKSVLTGTSDK